MKRPALLPKRALRKSEVAWVLGISEPTIKKLVDEGRLRAVRLSETTLRFLPDDLEAFIRAHETTPKKDPFLTIRIPEKP
jgi:excisionase family DNA binding protein